MCNRRYHNEQQSTDTSNDVNGNRREQSFDCMEEKHGSFHEAIAGNRT